VSVALELPNAEAPLHLLARVTTLAFDGAPADAPAAHVSLEFALLIARDRALLQGALIDAARSGRWLGAEIDAGAGPANGDTDPLDGARRSA